MKRISGHAIDPKYLEGCKPIPVNIAVYIDGYGAKLTANVLYDIADKLLQDELRAQYIGDTGSYQGLYNLLHQPGTPSVHADLISFCLAMIELHVVSVLEERSNARGTDVRSNAYLVNQSNPLEAALNGERYNLGSLFFPFTERDFEAPYYLDVTSRGTIFAPRKIEARRELPRLEGELVRARRNNDESRIAWIERNLSTVPKGVLHYRRYDGSIGAPVDFESTQQFYEAISKQVGHWSNKGETKVHWGQDLGDFEEKGVDCDLIMRVMDDLHSGQVDAFVFMTNDMDFFPLIERIRRDGKAVFLCGLGEGVARRYRVSKRLIRAAGDNFFDLTDPLLLPSLPSIFKIAGANIAGVKISREEVLQLTFLGMLNERRRKSD